MRKVPVHLFLKFRIGLSLRISILKLQNERHQRLGDEAATVNAEVAVLLGAAAKRIRPLHRHAGLAILLAAAARAARINARILSGSFSPGTRSTPEETSTPDARVILSASPTLPVSSPPDSMNGTEGPRFSRRCQSK